MIASEFDIEIYRKNLNLGNLNASDDELLVHYNTLGKFNGLIASEGQSRTFFQNLPLNFNSCLEIGPFFNPVLKGDNVKYFDVLNQEDLNKRAICHGGKQNSPYIQFVEKSGNLNIIDEKFDIVFFGT